MGKIFSFEALNGYVRSFDENPKSEIAAGQEAGITSLHPPPPLLPLVGHIPERLVDMVHAWSRNTLFILLLYNICRALFVDQHHALPIGRVRGL